MSKLAAICAKLQGGAIAVKDTTTSPFDLQEGSFHSQPLFPTPKAESAAADGEPAQHVLAQPLVPFPSAALGVGGTGAEATIGVLKRKIAVAPSTGSSRRKKQKPAASSSLLDSTVNSDYSLNNAEDSKSVDSSEHSLYIDLPDDHVAADGGGQVSRNKSPFQQYSSASSTSLPNTAMLQALGTSDSSDFNCTAASQSLAALAQQASICKAEDMGNSRVASPASLSGESLNDSHGISFKLGASGGSGKPKKPLDHSKYLTRYTSAQQCGSSYCMGMNYREHFHCLDCPSRIIVKKEEMIRHYKWHKKREDSLQHGFMRYSPFDDCTSKFGPCAHNNKQTHYHCIQAGCNKVYVSTSDVQMHANYHRKASAIIMEGFQRFRATEDCGTPNCDFYNQRTTHFHCRRPACNFTFKNKADMEKHKTYHQKDEILAKDGFKKYMKYEHCPYNGCAYSKLSNHIHCMRPGCQYVLHSTSQLYPHKRKHEKKESDQAAYPGTSVSETLQQTLKGAAALAAQYVAPSTAATLNSLESQQMSASATTASDLLSTVARLSQGINLMSGMKAGGAPPINPFIPTLPAATSTPSTSSVKQETPAAAAAAITANDVTDELLSDAVSESSAEQVFDKSLNLTPGRVLQPAAINWKTEKNKRLNNQAKSMMGHFRITPGEQSSSPGALAKGGADRETSGKSTEKQSELWKKYLTRYTANDPCNPRCWLLYKDHYHCNVDRCFNAFKNKDGVRDHARLHDNQEKITEQLFLTCPEGQQCSVEGCSFSEMSTHFHCKWMGCSKTIALEDDIFARLDHFQEHEFESRVSQATGKRGSQVALTSKLANKKRGRPPKIATAFPQICSDDRGFGDQLQKKNLVAQDSKVSYSNFSISRPCADELCKFRRESHYHCTSPRCHTSTNRLDVMHAHSVNFHNFVVIPENYAYFDRNVNCRGVNCSNNRNSCHYHCLRPGCHHSFMRHTTVVQHDKRHAEDDLNAKLPPKPPLLRMGVPSTAAHLTNATVPSPQASDMPGMTESPLIKQEINIRSLDRDDDPHSLSALVNMNNSNRTVKASGTFFPKSGQLENREVDNHDDSSEVSSSAGDQQTMSPATVGVTPIPPPSNSVIDGLGAQNSQASTMLNMLTQMLVLHQKSIAAAQLQQQQMLQAKEESSLVTVQDATWQRMLGRMYASPELPCSNVFCKKKQTEHYHCLECGTAFNQNNEAALKLHMSKHRKYVNRLGSSGSADSVLPGNTGSQFTQANQSQSIAKLMEAIAAQQNLAAAAAVENTSVAQKTPRRHAEVPDSSTDGQTTPSTSSNNVSAAMMKALQLQMANGVESKATEPSQSTNQNISLSDREEGESSAIDSAPDDETDSATMHHSMYKKFSKSKDCGYAKCVHCMISDHYHCLRAECTYSVVEQSKLPQHTKRHEKLDKIMGDDFKLYKQRSECGRIDCEFSSKSSHFHCLLCPYICTDASRILPHRKNHNSSSMVTSVDQSSV